MKKLIIFLIILLLSSFIFIPFNVNALETEYVPLVDFSDDTNGIFVDVYTNHQIISESGNKVLKDIKVGTGASNQRADVPTLPDSYEVGFDFKSESIGSSGSMIIGVTETAGITYVGWRLDMGSDGYLTLNSLNTSYFLNDNVWHNIFINVTTQGGSFVCRLSIDHDALSAPYNAGSSNYDEFVTIGGYETTTNNGFYWDNIIVASRLGSIPIVSFDSSPSDGDGLTNFIFTDTSIYDVIPFTDIVYWNFGDGNYTYSSPGMTVNHTYIHAGTYQVILNCSNRLGYDLAYTNITVTGISIGGAEFMSDAMFGFVIVVGLVTILNYLGVKLGFLMLSVFALLGMIFVIPILWQNDPTYISLMILMTLGNLGLLVYGFTRENN